MLKPYISEHDFRSSNNFLDNGYNLYVFDIKYQKNLENAQPIKVEVKFSEKVPAGIYGYALVLTNKMVSISSDSQHRFDLIYVYGFHNIFFLIAISVFFGKAQLYLSVKLSM